MTTESIMAELKQRRLPTFGTAAERRDRLRKFHGKSYRKTIAYLKNNQVSALSCWQVAAVITGEIQFLSSLFESISKHEWSNVP